MDLGYRKPGWYPGGRLALGQRTGILSDNLLFQMGKDLFNYRRIFDTCDDLDGASACITGRYIDIEYSFQGLCLYALGCSSWRHAAPQAIAHRRLSGVWRCDYGGLGGMLASKINLSPFSLFRLFVTLA